MSVKAYEMGLFQMVLFQCQIEIFTSQKNESMSRWKAGHESSTEPVSQVRLARVGKAWSSFRKQGEKSLFSQLNPMSWNPRVQNTHYRRRLIPSREQRGLTSCYGRVHSSF